MDDLLELGETVIVMYPYDASWWEIVAVVIEIVDSNNYKVMKKSSDDLLVVHKAFLV